MTPSEIDLFVVLRELATGRASQIDLRALRKQRPRLRDDEVRTRTRLFAGSLNISEDNPAIVGQQLAGLFGADARTIVPRAHVLQLVCSGLPAATDLFDRYEQRLVAKLKRVVETIPIDSADVRGLRGMEVEILTRRWPRELMKLPAWSRIESPVPGIADLPLDETWVDLTLRELEPRYAGAAPTLESAAWNELQFDRPGTGITPSQLLGGVGGLTVVAGPPGAGKSTLMKWLARHVIRTPNCPFGIPLLVSLRHYAREKAHDSTLTLLRYALQSRGVSVQPLAKWQALHAASLGIEGDDTFLWLLDGWDEVPANLRDRLLPEIQMLSLSPSVLTTRYSGDPLRLPAHKYFEIQGLKHQAALQLAHRWLARTGREEYYPAIETGLEESRDLRRMARSPFLLTLICSLASTPDQAGAAPALSSRARSAVLGGTLDLIYQQHNGDSKQGEKFENQDRADIARFALWLIADAPEAPRYVFDGSDYRRSGAPAARFDSLLVPSRLISRPSVFAADYQFVHTSFHEYLAAVHLRTTPDSVPDWDSVLLNPSWKEVIRFVAETLQRDSPAHDRMWQAARRVSRRMDRYGLVAARLALPVSAAGEPGGEHSLGCDVRESLWNALKTYAGQVPMQPLQAYLELDSRDLARRILDDRIARGRNSVAVAWLELISIFDLEPLFDDERYRRVLALPEVATFCPPLPEYVLEGGQQDRDDAPLVPAHIESQLRGTLEAARAALWSLIESGQCEAAYEAVAIVGRQAPPIAVELLQEVATSSDADELTRGAATEQLAQISEQACHALLLFVASLPRDDPRMHAIVGNLPGHVLRSSEVDLVMEVLEHEDPETRCAAADLLASTRSSGLAARFVERIKLERNANVRETLLARMEDMADDRSLHALWDLRDGKVLAAAEWRWWFGAVLAAHDKHQARTIGTAQHGSKADLVLSRAVRDWADRAIDSVEMRVPPRYARSLPAVLQYPGILGAVALEKLVRVANGRAVEETTRVAAIRAMARIGGDDAIDALRNLAKSRGRGRLEQEAACDTLGEISAPALGALKSPAADVARARLAYRHDMLFLPDDVIDASGRSMISKPTKPTKLTVPFKADVAVFTALQEEFEQFKETLKRRANVEWTLHDDRDKAFTYHGAQLNTANRTLSVVAVCAHEMATARATNLAGALMDRFHPAVVVVIGIAGALVDDLRLGDVLIPNEVYLYLENAAAQERPKRYSPRSSRKPVRSSAGRPSTRGAGRTTVDPPAEEWQFQLSGKHYECDQYLLNQARQLSARDPQDYRRWLERAGRRMSSALGPKGARQAVAAGVARGRPRLVAGDHHLATGPVVGKSTAFARWLRDTNRKVAAIEMETAAVFDAVSVAVAATRKLAIRGISDFADERKSMVEEQFQGKFRTLSMASAIDVFLLLAAHGAFAPR